MPSVEVWLLPEGDFVIQANNDLLLAYDTSDVSDATTQRIMRLLLTNPRLVGSDGRPISTPDDLFNPDYGAGLPALVDQPVTTAFLANLQARILSALLSDPTIAPTPTPVVTVNLVGSAQVSVSIKANTITGQSVVIPSLPIPVTTQ
ncbi:MAG: hypothetical protein KGL39_32950 [Patescibacteria group bacterium]|nr:hypothetical protein [Patescibacteria group bacterium]